MPALNASVFFSNFFSQPPIKLNRIGIPLQSSTLSPINYFNRKREVLSPGVGSVSCPPIDVDYLKREFSGHGVSFAEISDSCIVRMGLENGSVASVMLPSGLITSYKAPMWHGGLMELLHTRVSEGENGGAVVQGGMSLDFNCKNDEGFSWSTDSWILHEVKGTPQDLIQIELINRDSEGIVEVRYVISLQRDLLSSEFIISNSSASSLHLMASVISHLAVSTPEATYAVGLEGSDFSSISPILTNVSIIPPDSGERDSPDLMKSQGPMALLSNWSLRDRKLPEIEEDLEGEEEDNYLHLTKEMSRIYTNAPCNFTVIDRGRRNSVIIGGDGFDELYVSSPGSRHKSYSKYSYVSIGHTALREPIDLKSQRKWRGQHQLCNPNM